MYKSISVPMDGSRRTLSFLPHIGDLGLGYDTSLMIPFPPGEPVPAMADIAGPEIERVFKDARNYVRGLQTRLRKKGIRVHKHVLLGPVVTTIIDLVIPEENDLDDLAALATEKDAHPLFV